MAKMNTRAVDGTKATVKVVSRATNEIFTKEVVLSKDFTDDSKKLFKECVKALSNDEDLVIINVENVEKVHKLYGLDTAKFMELAIELDPETRKPIM